MNERAFRFRWVDADERDSELPAQPVSFGAILRLRKPIAPGDVKRQTGHALALRQKVQSGPPGARITSIHTVTRWPGTDGPKALHLCFTCPSLRLSSWSDLLSAPLGDWDDLHAYDARGLAALSVRHEQLVAVREDLAPPASTPRWFTETGDAPGNELDPRVLAFLLAPHSDGDAP